MKTLLFSMALIAGFVVRAEMIQYEILDAGKHASSMIQFSIAYTFGTHKGSANLVLGDVSTDENDNVIKAHFQVPIESITTGNPTRDCHTREALGINYTQSQFPKEHVCNSRNEIPATGPDSIQYPDITVEFLEMSLPSEPFTLGIPQVSQVKVKMSIHGVERIQIWPVTIIKTINSDRVPGFRLMSHFDESLKDFGVQVKSFMGIGVKDTVKVQIALDLVRN